MAKKKMAFDQLILKLLEAKSKITIHEVTEAARLSDAPANRRAVQRAFKTLIDRKAIEPHGKARARVYTLAITKSEPAAEVPPPDRGAGGPFRGIALSRQAEELRKYILQPIQAREPVGYNRDFLRSYEPNRTFYLTESQRADLLSVGRVENKVRPDGTYARTILNRLLIDLSWNSSRLEGNTYSLLETKRLLELGENAAGKDASEAQMILNHKAAIEYIIESAEDKGITFHQVCSIHALLSENLLGDPGASGRVREIIVGVSGTTYMPLENTHVLKEFLMIFLEKLNQIEDPFEQSLFSLVHLSYLQAFEDVNKRTARLVANIPMVKANLNPLSFTDVDQEAYIQSLLGIYERNDVSLFRDLYLWAYNRSAQRYSAIQQAMGEPNALKLRYRGVIQEIIRTIILEKVEGSQVVHKIQDLMEAQRVPAADAGELFKIVETEVLSLHEGNIARFKIRPSEFQEWKRVQ